MKHLKLGANVELCGYHLDVAPFYQNAAVYLHTSQLESFSMTLLESKAHGVPGVLYDLPNLELLRVGKGAVTVKQRDIPAAARAIVNLLRDTHYRKDMGRAARESTEVFLAQVDLSKEWTSLFDNLGADSAEDLAAAPSKEAVRNNIETIFNCIRAGIEWRDQQYIPQHYIPKWRLERVLRKGLASRLQRLGDSLRKRLSTRPRAKDLPLEKRLQRHARLSRQLTNILGAYAVVATIALCLR